MDDTTTPALILYGLLIIGIAFTYYNNKEDLTKKELTKVFILSLYGPIIFNWGFNIPNKPEIPIIPVIIGVYLISLLGGLLIVTNSWSDRYKVGIKYNLIALSVIFLLGLFPKIGLENISAGLLVYSPIIIVVGFLFWLFKK